MTLTGRLHVNVSVQGHPNRFSNYLCSDGARSSDEDAPRLFPAKATAHPLHLAHHLVGGQSCSGRAIHLRLRRGLTASIDCQTSLCWNSHCRVALKIKVLLSPKPKLPFDNDRSRGLKTSSDIPALDSVVSHRVERLGSDSFLYADDDVIFKVLVLHLNKPCRFLRNFQRLSHNDSQHHTEMPYPLCSENLLVLDDGSELVVSSSFYQVLVQYDLDHTFQSYGRSSVDRLDVAPGSS
mmetsp:Transcript_19652/g.41085  ORF Transcript_19652/g.41085 Transcript_19652/m.41085 type:complete len:237 (-) Transcript_19652:2149-2859(-)